MALEGVVFRWREDWRPEKWGEIGIKGHDRQHFALQPMLVRIKQARAVASTSLCKTYVRVHWSERVFDAGRGSSRTRTAQRSERSQCFTADPIRCLSTVYIGCINRFGPQRKKHLFNLDREYSRSTHRPVETLDTCSNKHLGKRPCALMKKPSTIYRATTLAKSGDKGSVNYLCRYVESRHVAQREFWRVQNTWGYHAFHVFG